MKYVRFNGLEEHNTFLWVKSIVEQVVNEPEFPKTTDELKNIVNIRRDIYLTKCFIQHIQKKIEAGVHTVLPKNTTVKVDAVKTKWNTGKDPHLSRSFLYTTTIRIRFQHQQRVLALQAKYVINFEMADFIQDIVTGKLLYYYDLRFSTLEVYKRYMIEQDLSVKRSSPLREMNRMVMLQTLDRCFNDMLGQILPADHPEDAIRSWIHDMIHVKIPFVGKSATCKTIHVFEYVGIPSSTTHVDRYYRIEAYGDARCDKRDERITETIGVRFNLKVRIETSFSGHPWITKVTRTIGTDPIPGGKECLMHYIIKKEDI